MPTAFADMAGRNGIDSHTAYTGLMINNLFVVLAALVTPLIIGCIGIRASLVLGSMCTIPINLALFYPYNYTIYLGQAINGIGNALSRALSLQFLTLNSNKGNMARNSGIHWMIFMSCIFFGNLVLYFGIGNRDVLDDGSRQVIAGAMTAMCVLGCVLYCFTIAPPEQDEEQEPLLHKQKASESDSSVTSSSDDLNDISVSISEDNEKELRGLDYFFSTLRPMFQKKNIYLLLPLCSTGIYSQLYAPLLPAYIGEIFPARSLVAGFGVFVGLGEMLGGRVAGKLVNVIGFKRASFIVTCLGTIIFTLIAFMFPLIHNIDPAIPPNVIANNALAVCIGVVDVSNNVVITTAIGLVYRNNSAQAFVLVVIMMNASGIVRFLMMSYLPLFAIVSVNVVGLWGACVSTCLIKCAKDK